MMTKTASQKGRSARAKGFSYERNIAKKFRHIYPNVKRQLEYQEGLGVDLCGMEPFAPQLKCFKSYAPLSKIEEVPRTADNIPLLITKGDRKPDIVAMYLDDFIKLVERLNGKLL